MKLFGNCLFLLLILMPTTFCSSAFAAEPIKVRVVSCDEPVQSHKRGVCENHLSADDFKALAPGVSWFYNWHYETKDLPPAGVNMEFLPMCWGDSPDCLDGLDRYLATHKPRAVLAINEPNLKGQAFIPPEQTARLYQKIKAIAQKHGVPVVGPHMALGSEPNESISADDPIENKKVTYTFMVPFLKAFYHYLGSPKKLDALGVHVYGNMGEFNWLSGVLAKEFNTQVWVTEYAWWKVPSDAEAMKFMVQSTDLLERSPQVQGYAWFKERIDTNQRISLFDREFGKLTPIGHAYVNLPVHDADVFYKLPGKLSAGKYVAMKDAQIYPSSDEGAFVDMQADKGNASCDYNLMVDAATTFTVRVRASGAESIVVSKTGLSLQGKAGKDWKTLETKLQLTKGSTTLRVTFTEKGQRIESIEFTKP